MATVEQIKALYRQRFPSFLRFAFRELYPGTPLVDSWHIEVLADHLARVARGEITRLIINMPPRSLKSFTTSVAFPVWLLGRNPTQQIIVAAGTRDLTIDLATLTDNLMGLPRCQGLFPHLKPQQQRRDLLLPDGGRRMAATVGSSLVGRNADMIIIDDPIAPAQVHDTARRNKIKTWFDAEII